MTGDMVKDGTAINTLEELLREED
ncbi:hypothetical protein NITHO_2510023 [Nitrolancea hollandica Lb]|uniref:Uncharacterized protein n=1 Tax=Nitrolancea hollandica Lb TaxID=1129897 RepID=I4EG13_9BACT|nr:hypothetical protein NITHO_2510023 [Nitrolancea hollandica Lb]